ncbi:MAG TPA: endonuclease III domain-containing protein [Planctomycetota bacterium]|nr:endonuclease III domain-containing protein [Planctomycetota bacterium]
MHLWYRQLLKSYGRQGWWPGETPFEVAVGAILAQNTAWTNVEKAIANLRRAGALSFRGMRRLPERKLAALIRPSGYYNQKAKKLRAFLAWLEERGGKAGSVKRALAGPLGEVRASLLGVHGVGPETADSILLYAGDRPVFVIDAYTRRVLARHGLPSAAGAPYEELRAIFERSLPRSTPLYNEFHALFVRLAKERCAKRAPRCEGCPLARLGFGLWAFGYRHNNGRSESPSTRLRAMSLSNGRKPNAECRLHQAADRLNAEDAKVRRGTQRKTFRVLHGQDNKNTAVVLCGLRAPLRPPR